MIVLIIAYPLFFLLMEIVRPKKKMTAVEWIVYGILMAAAFLLCLAAVQNWSLPNPIDWLANLFHRT